jgi:hypothetical protein
MFLDIFYWFFNVLLWSDPRRPKGWDYAAAEDAEVGISWSGNAEVGMWATFSRE